MTPAPAPESVGEALAQLGHTATESPLTMGIMLLIVVAAVSMPIVAALSTSVGAQKEARSMVPVMLGVVGLLVIAVGVWGT